MRVQSENMARQLRFVIAGILTIQPCVLAAPTATTSKIARAGVNLFGLANDVSILGSAYSEFTASNCNASYTAHPYVDPAEHYYPWRDAGFNLFRLPIAWQHAVTELSGALNETNMGGVDGLVELITGDGGVAIIDIHNYARWYCSIIGQPENDFLNPGLVVTDDDFVDLWVKLAGRYRNNSNVLFQLMNEPHDLNMTKWVATNQKVINAIRNVTSEQYILVSGTQFARLTNWQIYSESDLLQLKDPANKILFDFHQYFDDDGGAYGICEPWSTFLPTFQNVTDTLRSIGQRGILTEFGGAPVPACVSVFEGLLEFLQVNQDVWYGWTAWGSWQVGGPLTLSLNSSSPEYALTKVMEQYAPLSNHTSS